MTAAAKVIEGPADIKSFVQSISEVRDLLTLGALRRLLEGRCGVTLETLHDQLVASEIVEGMVQQPLNC